VSDNRRAMRVLVAMVTLVVMMLLVVADPALCADGCHDNAVQSVSASHESHDAHTECLICLHALAVAMSLDPLSGTVARNYAPERDTPVPTPTGHLFERPPRFS
jgi:hypothetical protein